MGKNEPLLSKRPTTVALQQPRIPKEIITLLANPPPDVKGLEDMNKKLITTLGNLVNKGLPFSDAVSIMGYVLDKVATYSRTIDPTYSGFIGSMKNPPPQDPKTSRPVVPFDGVTALVTCVYKAIEDPKYHGDFHDRIKRAEAEAPSKHKECKTLIGHDMVGAVSAFLDIQSTSQLVGKSKPYPSRE